MSNLEIGMSNKGQSPGNRKKYDLEERTAQFGEAVIELVTTLRQDPLNSPLVSQTVRAASSVGANHMEADGAECRKCSQHKVSIGKKEAEETTRRLRMGARTNPGGLAERQALSKKAHEPCLTLSSIILAKKQSVTQALRFRSSLTQYS
jgi:four helix bundle protein